MELSARWIDRANERADLKKIVLDLDSSESPVYGEQEGSAYNGYFGCECYHPLFRFNQYGHLERALLRNGNVHSAEDWRCVLEPVVTRYGDRPLEKFFRADAAFANPDVYAFLEKERIGYAIRIPANEVLEREIPDLLIRPVGRPSVKPRVFYAECTYRAETWDRFRRVVAKVEWHADELFPRVGFIVTNLMWSPAERVVNFYNQRGTAKQWIKEGKYAVKWTRLSCHDFRDNQVRLQLFALAYNLGNFLRGLALPEGVEHWSLRTLREKLVKIGPKVVRHARYIVFQLVEVAVQRRVFVTILRRIGRLCPAPVQRRAGGEQGRLTARKLGRICFPAAKRPFGNFFWPEFGLATGVSGTPVAKKCRK